ncbi:MAG TPA: ABC transporter substrate-binding protein [Candidatus Methylomirabilis sp.]|nr:ABC transporter substrate-binding protein [Candidatus Methylomirabilis sp.]
MPKKTIIAVVIAVLVIGVAAGSWYYYQTRPKVATPNTQQPTDNSLAIVKARGTLKVGADIPYATMEFFDKNGQPAGFDIDVINEIGRRMGVKVDVIDYDWDKLFPAVKSGELDAAISVIGITATRSREMLFSIPYINAGQTIVVRKSNTTITGPDTLRNAVVGCQKDTLCEQETAKYVNPKNVRLYESFEETGNTGALADLKNGKLDAVMVGYEGAIAWVGSNPDLKIAGTGPFTDSFGGIPTKLGNYTLINAINDAIRGMKSDGTLDKITAKWLNTSEQ